MSALHVTRGGTVTLGTTPIGKVVREVDGWSPTEMNGDYLGMTHYRRQGDAAVALLNWWKSTPNGRSGPIDSDA